MSAAATDPSPGAAVPGDDPPPAAALLGMARGLLALFWGIAVGLLGFSGAFRLALLEEVRAPSYLLGAGLAAWGAWSVRRRADRAPLRRSAGRASFAAALLLYLSPFVYWWQGAPHAGYFLAHMFALAAACLGLLAEGARLAAAVAERLGDPVLARESRACAALVAAAAVPLAAGFARVAWAVLAEGGGLYEAAFRLLYALPRWAAPAALLPFTLAMASLWRASRLCLARLAGR